ncbi:MAG: glycosyltransferase family 4 protein [Armatimonadota bacterium]|nr:glycosyltransferase family 4 protein [Armatimonadota bacterium]
MKILELITPSRLGGAERYVGWISREFQDRGHEVTVGMRTCDAVEKFYDSLGLKVELLAISGKLNPFAKGRIRKLIDDFGPDIVHTHLSTASLWGLKAADELTVPGFGHVHSYNSVSPYRAASALIAVSSAVKQHLISSGVSADLIHVVYPASNVFNARPAEDISVLSDNVITCASQLRDDKGVRVLFEAFTHILARVPDANLVFCGAGPLRSELAELALEECLPIHFVGYRNDVPSVFAASAVAVLPSLKPEGYGLSLVEAQAVGTPVIASRVGGVPEAMIDGLTGMTVEPGNASALAEAILALIENKNERNRMGVAGKEFSATRSVQTSAAHLLELFAAPSGNRTDGPNF